MPETTVYTLHTTKKGHTPVVEWGRPDGKCRGPFVFASEADAESFKTGIGKQAKHRRPKAITMSEVIAGARAKGQRHVWTIRRNTGGGLTFRTRYRQHQATRAANQLTPATGTLRAGW